MTGVQTCALPISKLNLIVGVFNGAALNHKDSNKYKNIVIRGVFSPFEGVDIASNYYAGKTDEARNPENLKKIGGSLSINYHNITILSEYLRSKAGDFTSGGYNAIIGYKFKTKNSFISGLQPIVRYEEYDRDINYYGDNKNRISLGLNIYLSDKYNKIQLNYQIYNEEENKINNNEFLISYQVALQGEIR